MTEAIFHRGPDGEGHSSEKHLPLTWNETENVRWKTNIDGLGWSTPSISGSQVWLTTALDQMRAFLTEFGMTPASRSRVKTANAKQRPRKRRKR